jgi:hypothetical protein
MSESKNGLAKTNTELVNPETGEVVQNNPFSVEKQEGIKLIEGYAREYRADCSKANGQFKIGEDNFKGKELDMVILTSQMIDDDLFGMGPQKWVEALFIDPDKMLSSIFFKTISVQNFLKYRAELHASETPIGTVVTRAYMQEKTSSQYGKFFAVDFKKEREVSAEFLEELKMFYAKHSERIPLSFRIKP